MKSITINGDTYFEGEEVIMFIEKSQTSISNRKCLEDDGIKLDEKNMYNIPGRIHISDVSHDDKYDIVYVCQNYCKGSETSTLYGYKYSWAFAVNWIDGRISTKNTGIKKATKDRYIYGLEDHIEPLISSSGFNLSHRNSLTL